MSSISFSSKTFGTLVCLGLSLPGWAGGAAIELGATLKLQRALGEYQTEILGDPQLGFGAGLRTRFNLLPHHRLTARLDYDAFPEQEQVSEKPYWIFTRTTKLQEFSLGLNYEWHYSNSADDSFFVIGPVYRRLNYHLDEIYTQHYTGGGPLPESHSLRSTSFGLGLDLGWGVQYNSGFAIEFHLVSSKFGETGKQINSAQFTFAKYW